MVPVEHGLEETAGWRRGSRYQDGASGCSLSVSVSGLVEDRCRGWPLSTALRGQSRESGVSDRVEASAEAAVGFGRWYRARQVHRCVRGRGLRSRASRLVLARRATSEGTRGSAIRRTFLGGMGSGSVGNPVGPLAAQGESGQKFASGGTRGLSVGVPGLNGPDLGICPLIQPWRSRRRAPEYSLVDVGSAA